MPAETARVAKACFPHDHPYLRLYDELGTLFCDHDFADLFPARAQPAVSPGRLAIVTLLQFAECLPDRQAADAVRSRIDWKYLLGIVVLSPAHQLLYSPFDRAIGHQRRCNRNLLLRCTPAGAQPILVSYLDSTGYLLSLANRVLLQQSSPTLKQILFWDKYIVPASRLIDPILGFHFGKSILGVWQVGEGSSI